MLMSNDANRIKKNDDSLALLARWAATAPSSPEAASTWKELRGCVPEATSREFAGLAFDLHLPLHAKRRPGAS